MVALEGHFAAQKQPFKSRDSDVKIVVHETKLRIPLGYSCSSGHPNLLRTKECEKILVPLSDLFRDKHHCEYMLFTLLGKNWK